jgi:hypothetical protein
MKTAIYIHGFTSWPGTSKGAFFKARLAEHNVPLRLPDFNVPSFERLTLTAQIEKLAQEVSACPDGEIFLIGSSMGGGVTVHFMDRFPQEANRVTKVVLLAPALDFMQNRQRQLGDEGIRRWRETGYLEVRHNADSQIKQLHYGLMEDLMQYNSFKVKFETPTLIIHGRQDESVDHRQSVRFTAGRPHVRLELVDADHSLGAVFDEMWTMIQPFLGL